MKVTTVSKATVLALGRRMKKLGFTEGEIPSHEMFALLRGERLWVTLDRPCPDCQNAHRDTHLFKPTKLPLESLFPAKG